MGLEVLVEGLEMTLKILNIYGPCTHTIHFWNTLFKKDLNFSLGEVEIWGPLAHPDPQTFFFSHLLPTNGFIEIVLTKLLPTWRNLRTRDAHVAKRLDWFLIT